MEHPHVLLHPLAALPDSRRGRGVHLPRRKEWERLGWRQDPFGIGVLDPKRSHLDAPECAAVSSERVGNGADVRP